MVSSVPSDVVDVDSGGTFFVDESLRADICFNNAAKLPIFAGAGTLLLVGESLSVTEPVSQME